MPYSELDKLQQEVEKLILEIKALKRPPILQPTTWVTFIGLFVSIIFNLSQCSHIQNANERATIQLERTQLGNEKASKSADSIKEQTKILQEEEKGVQMKYEDMQRRIVADSEALNKLSIDLASSASKQTEKTISDLQESFAHLSQINQNASQNFQSPGLSSPQNPGNNLQEAKEKEREGFQNLINGDYDNAAKSFQASEDAYNGYHWVYELARLIRSKKADLNTTDKRNELFRTILDKYSNAAPPNLLKQLKDSVNKP